YTDNGLSSDTTYTYSVTMRDAVGNTCTTSSQESATTLSGGGISDLIGIQFGPVGTEIAVDEVAGVNAYSYNQVNWNNVAGTTSGSSPNLVYDSGTSSGMSCSWTGTSNTFNTSTTGDSKLTGNFVQNGSAGAATFVLSNIPYTSYDLVLYYNAFGDIYNDSQVDLDYGSNATVDQSVFVSDKDTFVSFNGDEYVEFISSSSSSGAPAGANFGVVTGLTASNLTITVVNDASEHNSLAGIQLVNASAP
ncbi:MAG: hypothetical protein HQ517_03310, partial [SAR324 cluster bacterium]|nr:hypothetical protein [SAR324 cluster bacterium]